VNIHLAANQRVPMLSVICLLQPNKHRIIFTTGYRM